MFKLLKLFGFSLEHGFALWDVGSAIGIGSSILGGVMGDDSAKQSSAAQQAAGRASLEEINKQKQENTTAYAPYVDVGTKATDKLSYLLGLTDMNDGSVVNGVSTAYEPKVTKDVGRLNGRDWLYKTAKKNGSLEAYYQLLETGALDESTPTRKHVKTGQIRALQAKLNAEEEARRNKKPLNTSDGQYGSLLKDFSQADLNKDVVYNTGLQFGLDQGSNEINNRARSSGSSDSGAVLKALLQFGNDYGTTKASGAYDRFNQNKGNIYNMLTGQQMTGFNATNAKQNQAVSLTNGAANVQSDIGNARAAGIMGQANARSNALSGIAKQDWSWTDPNKNGTIWN